MRQRLIVELPFKPNKIIEPHPGIIITPTEDNELNGTFYAVMMTTSLQNDQNTFLITDDMVTVPMGISHSEARIHIIEEFSKQDLGTHKNCMLKIAPFNELIKKILMRRPNLKYALE